VRINRKTSKLAAAAAVLAAGLATSGFSASAAYAGEGGRGGCGDGCGDGGYGGYGYHDGGYGHEAGCGDGCGDRGRDNGRDRDGCNSCGDGGPSRYTYQLYTYDGARDAGHLRWSTWLMCDPNQGPHAQTNRSCAALSHAGWNPRYLSGTDRQCPHYNRPVTARAQYFIAGVREFNYVQTFPNECYMHKKLDPVFNEVENIHHMNYSRG